MTTVFKKTTETDFTALSDSHKNILKVEHLFFDGWKIKKGKTKQQKTKKPCKSS